eukprot:TRINITY_DN17269_c0_g1_i1.p1 TRINITY_DN17269_c0_g1~~TRINITY_DN17269_c0_g1_i1.p1  ORF type:complete len:504 (+),score=107.23 TRINITY_DN17269_c0_g1_i1:95-1606(+)
MPEAAEVPGSGSKPRSAQPGTVQPFWSRVKTQSPGLRPHKSCCMSAVIHNGSMVLFGGGVIENYYDDIFRIDLDTHVWTHMSPANSQIVPRTLSHTAVVHRGSMYVFGGMAEGQCHNSCHRISLDGPLQWETINAPSAPAARKGHQAAVWGNRMYIFMGAEYSGQTMSDVHYLDLDTRQWHQVPRRPGSPWPRSRTGHSVAVRHSHNALYLFGGMTRDDTNGAADWLNDLWVFNFATGLWEELTPRGLNCEHPAGRYSQISWTTDDSLLVFGGDTHDCQEYFDDLWQFSFDTGLWRRLNCTGDCPSARSGHVGCAWRGSLYMFGGEKPRKQSGADDRAPGGDDVHYSNSLYQMPHFIEGTTSLKAIVARHIISEQMLSTGDREDFWTACRRQRLPGDITSYLDGMRPRGKRRRRQRGSPAGPPRRRSRLDKAGRSQSRARSSSEAFESDSETSVCTSESFATEDPGRSRVPSPATPSALPWAPAAPQAPGTPELPTPASPAHQ